MEPIELPEAERLFDMIRQRIQSKESAFSLHAPLAESLAKVAAEIANEDSVE